MRVLIVDGHPMFRDGVEQCIQNIQSNLVVDHASSAEEAIGSLLRESLPDLVLIDLVLPDMDGEALLGRMVEQNVWVPTLILSAHDDPRLIIRALDAGAAGYLSKSSPAQMLVEAVRIVMQGQEYLPEEISEEIAKVKNQQHQDGTDQLQITPRQSEVLRLMGQGFSNRKIAQSIFISEHTVKSHVKALFKHLNVSNRTSCVKRAEQLGLID